MNSSRPLTHRICIGLALVAVAATMAPAAVAASHAIRVPASAVERLAGLGLQAQVDLDYGGFRWMVVDDDVAGTTRRGRCALHRGRGRRHVQVQGYRFDPIATASRSSRTTSAHRARIAAELHLVQLVGPVRDEWTAELDLGRHPAAPVLPPQQLPRVGRLDHHGSGESRRPSWVRWQGRFHPAYKLNARRSRAGPGSSATSR